MSIDFDKVSKFCRDNYPDIVDAKIKISEDVCNNTYLFDMPHDLERTTEAVHFDGDINWEYELNGDKEFAYQMSRHRYFVDLAESYHLTGDERYVERIVFILLDFINRCPYNKASLAWRTLETGLRGEYWTRAMALIKDSKYITEDVLKAYRESLDVHAKVLVEGKINHHRLSNWGVLQDHGLFAIGLELDNEEYINIALDRLYEEARLQLMGDGVHWEVSTTYHNEVLQCFIDTMIRAKDAGITLDEDFEDTVLRMAYVDAYWVKPDHTGPLYGDSDVVDLRGIFATTALLFNNSILKGLAGEIFDYDNAWRFGDEGISEYAKIPSATPLTRSVALSDSGNYIMRTGYGEDDNYLIFHNSNTGGGHAHEDKLSFELAIKGKDVLVDTGRYTYVWNAKRKEIKSFRAHNTTAVDGKHFITALWWAYLGPIAPSIREEMIIEYDYEFIRGTHAGYAKKGITTSRSILWLKNDIYIIIDEFFGGGRHKYNSFFNFAPNVKLNINGNIVVASTTSADTLIKFMDDSTVLTLEKGIYSHHYNAIEDIDRIVTTTKVKGNAHLVTVIVGDKAKYRDLAINKIAVKDSYGNLMKDADAVKIKANGVTYTLIMQFKEHNGLLLADDKPATGKFTLYKDDEYKSIKW